MVLMFKLERLIQVEAVIDHIDVANILNAKNNSELIVIKAFPDSDQAAEAERKGVSRYPHCKHVPEFLQKMKKV